MKYLLLILMFTTFSLEAQLVSEDHRWNIGVFTWLYPMTGGTKFVRLDTATVFNGLVYHELLNSVDSMVTWQATNLFLREDSSKVYKNQGLTSDELLYDFSMQIGDTINNLCPFVVTTIDSVVLNNLEVRKRITLEPVYLANPNLVWIEGIGSTSGLIDYPITHCLSDVYSLILCFYRNDSLIFESDPVAPYFPNYGCYVDITLPTEDLSQTGIQIYPNPFVNKINIDQTNHNSLSCSIYSIQGELIITKTINQRLGSIDLSWLATGMYILSLKNEDGQQFYQKIVKE